MNRVTLAFVVGAAMVMFAVECVEQTFADSPTQGLVKVIPSAVVIAKATAPPGSAKTNQVASIGAGKLKVSTANAPGDTDSLWVEEIDIDGDGEVERTYLLWDDEDKVLYLYATGTFTCVNGGIGDGGLLIAVFGEGNPQQRSVGSGWYAAELDKSECAAAAAGLFGCRFDAKGKTTTCGAVRLDENHDDIVVVTLME